MKRFFIIWMGVWLTVTACQNHSDETTSVSTTEKTAQSETALKNDPSAAAKIPDVLPETDPYEPGETLHVAVISDINESYGTIGYSPVTLGAVQDIIRRKADFVLSPGDLVAGQKQGLDYDAMWRAFHYQIGDVFFDNDIEFFMAPGNHDASAYSQHFAERQAMARAFENRLPKTPLLEGSHYPFYYAVEIRGVLVVALDITRPIRNDDPQLEWLALILEKHASRRANLIIGHLPIFPIDFGSLWEVAGSSKLLDILTKSPSPTLYISGHHHIYYPAHFGELRLVACPALGAGPRSIYANGRPMNGYVMIDIPPDAPPKVTALIAPNFNTAVNIKSLPEQRILLEREDVGMAEYIMEMLDKTVTVKE